MDGADFESHGFDGQRLSRLTTWMDGYVEARKHPGSAILIHRGGQEVFFAANGHRDVEAGQPWTRDTVVRLYSMTKPVTTVAAMMLVERGLFALDAPVSAFIPEFSDMLALIPGAERLDQTEAVPPPTVHQLMIHTSGLSYGFNPGLLGKAMAERGLDFNPRQGRLAHMAARVAGLPLAFRPGARWEYSVATDILGRVVEVASGQTLDAFFRDHIFDPLGMSETGFGVPGPLRDRFAALYTPLDADPLESATAEPGAETLKRIDGPADSPFLEATMYSGGGGLLGTIDDYMRFAEMLRQRGQWGSARLLGPHIVDFMMQNHLHGDIASMGPSSFAEQPMDGVGFGLGGAVVLDPARMRTPGHAGDFSWGGMASTFFWIDRAADMSVVFLTQLTPSSSYPSRAEMKALVNAALIA